MPEPTLFDLEPTPAEPTPSYGRRLTERRRAMIKAGVHPVTRLPLLEPRGKRCGGCEHLLANRRGNTTYWKCDLNVSRGPATDIRVRWPACDRYQAHEEEK